MNELNEIYSYNLIHEAGIEQLGVDRFKQELQDFVDMQVKDLCGDSRDYITHHQMKQAMTILDLPEEFWVKKHRNALLRYMTRAMNVNDKSNVVLPEGFLDVYNKLRQ